MLIRLQKILAEAGVASRRASEAIILEGRVTVNGEVVKELGVKVEPGRDRVSVDGLPLKAKRKLHIALNKPPGYICTKSDPLNRRTVGELLPREWTNLYPVGRLDYESEGLIFLSNDGDFCLHLTHPRYGVTKTYLATVEGKVTPSALAPLTTGVVHEGDTLKAQRARILSATNSESVVEIILAEGKNREVRRMLEVIGFVVTRLQRVQIGRIKLGDLPLGKWRALTEPEIKSLLSKL